MSRPELGERAILEHGWRTSTLRSVTPVKLAVAGADASTAPHWRELSTGHRREEQRADGATAERIVLPEPGEVAPA